MTVLVLHFEADITIYRAPKIAQDMFHAALVLLSVLLAASPLSVAEGHRSIPEELEWTWEVRPSHPDPKLPNRRLLGDSSPRNYYPCVPQGHAEQEHIHIYADFPYT